MQRGTAAKAASLKWPLGGKTGTTDDFTDAWFIGFDPDVTIGVWVGYDRKKTLGPGESGATAALPIWMDIMKAWIGDRKETPEFAGARQHRLPAGRSRTPARRSIRAPFAPCAKPSSPAPSRGGELRQSLILAAAASRAAA